MCSRRNEGLCFVSPVSLRALKCAARGWESAETTNKCWQTSEPVYKLLRRLHALHEYLCVRVCARATRKKSPTSVLSYLSFSQQPAGASEESAMHAMTVGACCRGMSRTAEGMRRLILAATRGAREPNAQPFTTHVPSPL